MSDTRIKSNPWATGIAVFAATLMVLGGLVQAMNGLIALSHDVVVTSIGDYVFGWDADLWGWLHLLAGVVVLAAGIAVFAGKSWARMVGIAVALGAAVLNFAWLPYYPIASVVMIAIDVLVIWALATFQPVD